MQNYTITPIITGYTHTNKATYLYHHSIHKYYDTEGFVDLPVTIFLVQGNGCKILIFTYDNIKEVPEAHYDITPPGRFLDIVDSWNSIVELKSRVKSPEFILPTHAPEMIELVESGKILGV